MRKKLNQTGKGCLWSTWELSFLKCKQKTHMRWKQDQVTWLKELGFFSLGKGRQSGPYNCIQISEGMALGMDPGSSELCQAIGQKTIGWNWCIESFIWIWGRTLLCRWLTTETDFPERSLPHRGYSITFWMQLLATCSRMTLCLSREIRQDGPPWSLPTLPILWYCNSGTFPMQTLAGCDQWKCCHWSVFSVTPRKTFTRFFTRCSSETDRPIIPRVFLHSLHGNWDNIYQLPVHSNLSRLLRLTEKCWDPVKIFARSFSTLKLIPSGPID